jgi:hypothetical protein
LSLVVATTVTIVAINDLLTDGFAADIVHYLQDKLQGKFGKHRYSAEEMGIDVAELNARCRF